MFIISLESNIQDTNCVICYSGALGGKLCVDALNVRRLVGDNLALLVQCTATLVCGILIAMIADWKLSLIILFVIPLIGLQGYAQVRFLQGFSQDAKVSK
jgi:ATP-binding cassette subfamily B (MDR/TAP) protein 1